MWIKGVHEKNSQHLNSPRSISSPLFSYCTVLCSFQVAIHVQFADEAGHNAYQVHPLHKVVVECVMKNCVFDDKVNTRAFDWTS